MAILGKHVVETLTLMATAQRKNYQGRPIFKVKVIAVRPHRLLVKLPDGETGIILKRDWTWDRSVWRPAPVFSPDDELEAVVLPRKSKQGRAYLSLCELSYPWEDVASRYKVGDSVRGEVVNLRGFGAFVQIEPGITALVWARDMPLQMGQIPSDVLGLGDHVRGVITQMDAGKEKLRISVREELGGIEGGTEGVKAYLKSLFRIEQKKLSGAAAGASGSELPLTRQYEVPPLSRIKQVLIVDDNERDQKWLQECIEQNFGAATYIASGEQEAAELLRNNNRIDLAIIDLSLANGERGTEVAYQLIAREGLPEAIFVSADAFAEEELENLENKLGRHFAFAPKYLKDETDENDSQSLIDAIHGLELGRLAKQEHISMKGQRSFVSQLGLRALANIPLEQKLKEILLQLQEETGIAHAFLLEVDRDNRLVALKAHLPSPQEGVYQNAMDGLFFSPVREVIESEEPFSASNISFFFDDKGRFKNFFPSLFYQCCYGVPVPVEGLPLNHVFFVMDDKQAELSKQAKERVSLAGNFLSIALERAQMLEFMQQYEDRYFQGQLFSTFIHELRNRLQPIRDFAELARRAMDGQKPQEALRHLEKLEITQRNANELADSYSRLSKGAFEQCSVNEIVRKVGKQLEPYAKRNGIQLHFELNGQEPQAWAIPIHVEQVVSNIILNAIQQTLIQQKAFREIYHSKGDIEAYPPAGMVVASTSLKAEEKSCRITVVDNGPGVPFSQREHIFRPGFSTREEGHGLGLFISKNLVEAMNGRLYLADSLRFLGSAFAVLLPAAKNEASHG